MSSNRARRLVQPAGIATLDLRDTAVVDQPVAAHEPRPMGTVPAQADLRPAVDVEAAGFHEGFAKGEQAALVAAAARVDPLIARLGNSIDALDDVRASTIRQLERQMVELALTLARRIVHRDVRVDPDLLIAMARVALDRLGECTRVTVQLHPDDLSAIDSARPHHVLGGNVTIVADPSLPRGGCRIESEHGRVDAGVDAQIEELARALIGDEPQPVGNDLRA